MSWNINEEVNTLRVPADKVESLFEVFDNEEHDWCGCAWVEADGTIYTDSDAMEHMDCFWNEDLQKIMLEHGVEGRICFSSSEGDDRGEKWGYEFKDGKVKKLKGTTSWD